MTNFARFNVDTRQLRRVQNPPRNNKLNIQYETFQCQFMRARYNDITLCVW